MGYFFRDPLYGPLSQLYLRHVLLLSQPYRTGIVSISPTNCMIQCYTNIPRGCRKSSTNIAKITLHRHDPIYTVISTSSLSKLLTSGLPCQTLPSFYVPNLSMIDQTALHSLTHVLFVVAHIMYIIGAALPICLSLKRQLSASNLSLLYARPGRKHVDKVFLVLPIPVVSYPTPSSQDVSTSPLHLSSSILGFHFYTLSLPVKFFCHFKSRHPNLYHCSGTYPSPSSLNL